MINQEIANRLNLLIETQFPDKAFITIVREHGFNYDTLRKIKEGKSSLGMKTLLQFLEMVPDTSLDWLFFNDGNMLRNDNRAGTQNTGLKPNDTKDILKEMESILKKFENTDT